MKLLDAFRTEWHFDQGGRRRVLPPTAILGVPYQQDWLDFLGVGMILFAVAVGALAMVLRSVT